MENSVENSAENSAENSVEIYEKTDHQKMAIQALEMLQEICNRHGITLYLLAGTCLGAVREKGMIPWDDDIDVGFTYDEWYQIRKILPEEIEAPFSYADYEVVPGFPRMFGKILYDQQSCVDIFLIAKFTTNDFFGEIHWQIRRFAVTAYKYSIGYKAPQKPKTSSSKKKKRHARRMRKIRHAMYLMTKPFCTTESYIKMNKWNEQYYEHRKYDCYINLYSVYHMDKERINKEWIENTSLVEFEGKMYNTVGDTDAYLTHLYGDYMTPPPEKKRKAMHGEVFS